MQRLGGVHDPPLKEDFQGHLRADKIAQATDFRIRHHQPELADRSPEAARFTTNADIAKARNLQAAADAGPLNHGHHRRHAIAKGADAFVHQLPVGFRLFRVGPLLGKFGNVVAGAEGPVASAAKHDTADLGVRRKSVEGFTQQLPHVLGKGIELLRTVEDHRRDVVRTLNQDGIGHRIVFRLQTRALRPTP